MSHVAFDKAMAEQAAQRLDGLADLLDDHLARAAAALTPAPAGSDAVSQRAASTFRSVGESYQDSYRGGARELRKLAANVRAHTRMFDESEMAGAQLFPTSL